MNSDREAVELKPCPWCPGKAGSNPDCPTHGRRRGRAVEKPLTNPDATGDEVQAALARLSGYAEMGFRTVSPARVPLDGEKEIRERKLAEIAADTALLRTALSRSVTGDEVARLDSLTDLLVREAVGITASAVCAATVPIPDEYVEEQRTHTAEFDRLLAEIRNVYRGLSRSVTNQTENTEGKP